MPPKTLFRLGLSFLFLALAAYFFTGHWLNTRISVPLNYPVSLDARHLQSPPFQINLSETYYADLGLDYGADDWKDNIRCDSKKILYPQWRVYKLPPPILLSRVSSGQPPKDVSGKTTIPMPLRDNTSWSGIFRLPLPVSIPAILAFL